jgi:hypothetical protein
MSRRPRPRFSPVGMRLACQENVYMKFVCSDTLWRQYTRILRALLGQTHPLTLIHVTFNLAPSSILLHLVHEADNGPPMWIKRASTSLRLLLRLLPHPICGRRERCEGGEGSRAELRLSVFSCHLHFSLRISYTFCCLEPSTQTLSYFDKTGSDGHQDLRLHPQLY